jgi:hypothetical protein
MRASVSEGVGELSFNETEVVILAGVHKTASHESSETVGADTSGSWLNLDFEGHHWTKYMIQLSILYNFDQFVTHM